MKNDKKKIKKNIGGVLISVLYGEKKSKALNPKHTVKHQGGSITLRFPEKGSGALRKTERHH